MTRCATGCSRCFAKVQKLRLRLVPCALFAHSLCRSGGPTIAVCLSEYVCHCMPVCAWVCTSVCLCVSVCSHSSHMVGLLKFLLTRLMLCRQAAEFMNEFLMLPLHARSCYTTTRAITTTYNEITTTRKRRSSSNSSRRAEEKSRSREVVEEVDASRHGKVGSFSLRQKYIEEQQQQR